MRRSESDTKSRSEWLSLLNEWIHSERDRKLLTRYMLDGITLEKVAEEFDISTIRAYQVV